MHTSATETTAQLLITWLFTTPPLATDQHPPNTGGEMVQQRAWMQEGPPNTADAD